MYCEAMRRWAVREPPNDEPPNHESPYTNAPRKNRSYGDPDAFGPDVSGSYLHDPCDGHAVDALTDEGEHDTV